MRPSLRPIVARALRLRCPHCGEGTLFRGVFAVRDSCFLCGLAFFRESGYFVASMYVNVVLTEAIIISTFVASLFLPPLFHIPWPTAFALWMLATVVISLGLTRWTRSFWLAFDYWLEPWTPLPPQILDSEVPPR